MLNPSNAYGITGQNFLMVQNLLNRKLMEYQRFPERLAPKDLKDLSDAVGHNWKRELGGPPTPPGGMNLLA